MPRIAIINDGDVTKPHAIQASQEAVGLNVGGDAVRQYVKAFNAGQRRKPHRTMLAMTPDASSSAEVSTFFLYADLTQTKDQALTQVELRHDFDFAHIKILPGNPLAPD